MEGKRVIFVMDENDAENADGIRGHLEAVGDACYVPGFMAGISKEGLISSYPSAAWYSWPRSMLESQQP